VFVNGSRNFAKTNNPGVAHTQVANAPEFTLAGGLLFKRGPIAFSLIDKYTGSQWFVDGEVPRYKSNGYNSAIASLRYDFGHIRVGVEVNNLFDSREVTNINAGKTTPFDQYFYQTGRSVSADITLTF
jgi:iron complex outermembrane receptor protein